MKLCSCPLKSMYCFKKCPGVHSTLDNATTASLQQNTISAEYARCLQHNYNIPIPANKCRIQTTHTLLNKSNLPLGHCSVFLQGHYPKKKWSIPWKVAPCPLKECSVHFQMSNLPIFLHNICRIIDTDHRFQKCNMFETVSIVKQCSAASCNRILSCMATQSYREKAAFLENWNSFVWYVYSCQWSDQPRLHLDNSHLKKCFRYYPTIMYSFNQISHSYSAEPAQIQQ